MPESRCQGQAQERPRGRCLERGLACGGWLAAAVMVLMGKDAPAQEALRNSLVGQAAAEARARQLESRPYSWKTGDFKVLVAPILELDWNDNVNLSHSDAQQDFILRPALDLTGSYPISTYNVLSFNVGVGYDQYFQHEQFSGVRLQSGSELAFDVGIKDVWIHLHDRFQFIQDSASEAAVAETARFGSLQNTAGFTADWDLSAAILTAGYDHYNFISSSSQFEYLDHSSEFVLARAGLRPLPTLVAGVEGTGGFTRYDQRVLNDSQAYSGGVYGDWQPGAFFRVQPRFGYTVYQFDQTSRLIRAEDQQSWYADLTFRHEFSQAMTYSISVGRELRLGIQSDAIEDWYVRPNLRWGIFRRLTLNLFVFYEHGKETGRNLRERRSESYDWGGWEAGLSYAVFRRLTASLNYRLTLRSSDVEFREYQQNLLALRLNYAFQ